MAGFADILDRMTDDVEATFSTLIDLTRGDRTVRVPAILDYDARTAPVAPSDVPTEGVQPRLDVKVARCGVRGRPQHQDHVLDCATGRRFEIVAVEDGALGCVSCWLLELAAPEVTT